MMRVAGPVAAILAFALGAGAEEGLDGPPEIRLTTLPNPVADPVATANRRTGPVGDGGPADLSGVFSVRHHQSSLSYAWDPAECRMMFCRRGADLIYLAEGPGPAAATAGAFGSPKFFGYRRTGDGFPEFLYRHGRLGIEEQIRPGKSDQTLAQRFRVENADYGLVLMIPARWKDRIKSSAGRWKGELLSLSGGEAKSGFTLTYDLTRLPDLPEIAGSWKNPSAAEDAPSTHGPPPPPSGSNDIEIKPAPGFIVRRIAGPPGEALSNLLPAGDGRLAAATRSGRLFLTSAEPADGDIRWSPFSAEPIPGLGIEDAREMPNMVAISHAYGSARLFDTDEDGRADFFKATGSGETSAVTSDRSPPLILPDWDVFEVSLLESSDEKSSTRLHLKTLGLNPERPSGHTAGESWVGLPRALGQKFSAPITGDSITLVEQSNEKEWRLIRVLPDRVGNTLQGAALASPLASLSAGGPCGPFIPGRRTGEIWAVPASGDYLAKISPDGAAGVFEVRAVHLARDAFEFTFSKPVDRKIATDLTGFRVRSTDPDGKGGSERHHRIAAAIVDSDGLTLALRIGGVTPGRVIAFELGKLRSESGAPLNHGPVFYSVNVVPELRVPDGKGFF